MASHSRTSARTNSSGGGARIGSGAKIRGRVSGNGDLTVDGSIEGEVSVSGNLVVSETGSVKSDAVDADSITVAGTLEAEGQVTGQLRVLVGSRVRCNVKGGIVLDDGAEFFGKIDADFDLPAELEGHASGRRGRN